MSSAVGVSPDPNAAEAISAAIEADASFIGTDGYRSIRMRSGEKYAEIALAALAAVGLEAIPFQAILNALDAAGHRDAISVIQSVVCRGLPVGEEAEK